MAYFNELPFIEYPLRFQDQSSNEDYTLVRNIFRRALFKNNISDFATIFTYYQIKDNERPDQIAEKIYGDPELDWVILITNNIIQYPSQWTLNNETFYDYLIEKYGSEDAFSDIKYIETQEVRDEYERLVVPAKLQIDKDFYQKFTTIANKTNPFFYELNSYPVPSDTLPLEVKTNLDHYLEVWERDNIDDNVYTGEVYPVSEIYIQKPENPEMYQIGNQLYPDYTRLDYSYLFVDDQDGETKNIFVPITLDGWPSTWGGKILIHNRENQKDEILLSSKIGNPIDITDDFRLYSITSLSAIDRFTYSEGTVIQSERNQSYLITNPESNKEGKNAKFEVKRNLKGEIIIIKLIYGGYEYTESEILTIKGSQIGGVDIIDDIQITIVSVKSQPAFRFNRIGSETVESYPGVEISIFNETGLSYLNTSYNKVDIFDNQNEVTNYEYEVEQNEKYRKILVLKPNYLGVFTTELKNIMSYDKSSETITSRIKKVSNPRITN